MSRRTCLGTEGSIYLYYCLYMLTGMSMFSVKVQTQCLSSICLPIVCILCFVQLMVDTSFSFYHRTWIHTKQLCLSVSVAVCVYSIY